MRLAAVLLKLALAAAAGLFTAEAGWAAEPAVNAKPVQYVRICSGYGDGFYYVPGTDTCVKLGGYLRVQTEYNMGGGAAPDGTLGQVAQARYNRVDTNDIDFRVRASLTFDARSQTEFGVLRSYIELGIQQTTPANNTNGAVFWSRAFIQWAGFTVGRAESFFDIVSYGFVAWNNIRTVSETPFGWNVWAYTAQLGNGFSATLSLEDPNRDNFVVDGTAPAAFGYGGVTTDNAFAGQSATNTGMRMPDVVGQLRVSQTWGFAAVAFALHDVAGAYFGTPNNVANGHPADKKGWAVSAGVLLILPNGDELGFNGQYSIGAAGYGAAASQWAILKPGTSVGLGWAVDGVFDNGREIELTTVWNVVAFYEHSWNERWRTSWFGGYAKVDYNNAATQIINSHLPAAAPGTVVCGVPVGGAAWPPIAIPAGGAGNSCNPDFSLIELGTRTVWNPYPNLDIGIQLLYTRLNTAYKGVGIVAPGGPQNAVPIVDNQDIVSVLFRWQRNFYP